MKKPDLTISIALCTYNGEKYIKEQLNSIFSQEYQASEIIVVDDGSTDATIPILKEYQQHHPQLQLHQNTQRLGFNRNFMKALSLCNSAYIAIADQDDIWLPEKLKVLINIAGQNLLVYHDALYIDSHGNETGKKTSTLHRFVSGQCAENLVYYNCVSGHASLIKRTLLELTPPPNDLFYFDWWLAYTAACAGSIIYTDQCLVKHRKHPESATKQDISSPKKLRPMQLRLFIDHPLTPAALRVLLNKLLHKYETISNKKFSWGLFILLMRNAGKLLYIRRRNPFSQLKFIIRECSA